VSCGSHENALTGSAESRRGLLAAFALDGLHVSTPAAQVKVHLTQRLDLGELAGKPHRVIAAGAERGSGSVVSHSTQD
jgi:hypothetical protein